MSKKIKTAFGVFTKPHTEEDHCNGCDKELTQEEYITEAEPRGEFWGAPAEEQVVRGYVCENCGFTAEF